MKPINYQVCCGSSSPGSWVQFGADGLYSDINTKGCEFKNTPYYFSSITDTACGKELLGSARCTAKAIGSEAHYSSSKDGFRTYVKNIAGEPYLNQATARSNGWQLNWCGVAASPPTTEGSAGYPCASQKPTTQSSSGALVGTLILVGWHSDADLVGHVRDATSAMRR